MVSTSFNPAESNSDPYWPTPLSENAKVVMDRRITARNDRGDSIETPDECFRRVAHNLAEVEICFGGSEQDRAAAERLFFPLAASQRTERGSR